MTAVRDADAASPGTRQLVIEGLSLLERHEDPRLRGALRQVEDRAGSATTFESVIGSILATAVRDDHRVANH